MTRLRSRAPKGERAYERVPRNRGKILRVLRAMRVGDDGLPMVGPAARKLGARPGAPPEGDIPIEGGVVRPGMGGMSVSPRPPKNLPRFRRPPEFGGIGKDPAWQLETGDLPGTLRYRPDPEQPERHGFVEPSRAVGFDEYQAALRGTSGLWRRLRQDV